MSPAGESSSFQTQGRVQDLLNAAGLSPRKCFGQCFLIDRNLMGKLVASADLARADTVLEVGCGTGSLTGLLASVAGHVVAVEIDPRLVEVARRSVAGIGRVRLLNTDALEGKSKISGEVAAALVEARGASGGALKLVANLPYDIATPIVMNLLLGDLGFERLCFTVQAEVAGRFLAAPRTRAYGPVSILAQSLAVVRRIARVPPQAFWPSPKVDSAMLRLDVKSKEAVGLEDAAAFAVFVRRFFRQRRKTLAHIARKLRLDGEILPRLERLGLPAASRPEDLSPEQWVDLHGATR